MLFNELGVWLDKAGATFILTGLTPRRLYVNLIDLSVKGFHTNLRTAV